MTNRKPEKALAKIEKMIAEAQDWKYGLTHRIPFEGYDELDEPLTKEAIQKFAEAAAELDKFIDRLDESKWHLGIPIGRREMRMTSDQFREMKRKERG